MGFFAELGKLTRFEHAIMLAFAVLIGETVVLQEVPLYLGVVLVVSLLVPVFSEMGSFALNDYLDIETDRLNKKKDRPLVKGTISPEFALNFSIACLIVSALLAYFINTASFVIAIIFNIAAIAYNWKLKDMPLVGNLYIALTMAIPFIFGNFVVSETLSPLALALAVLGFVAGLAREIVKSVQDVEGDVEARGSKTLPVIIGKMPSVYVAVLLYLLFIPLSFSPFLLGLSLSAVGIVMIAAGDILILWICYALITQNDYKFARNFSLISFMAGLLGLMVASL